MIEDTIKANTEAIRDMIDILCQIKISQDKIIYKDERQTSFDFNSSNKDETKKPTLHPTAKLLNEDQKTIIRKRVTDLKIHNDKVDTSEFGVFMESLGYKGLSSVPQGHYQKLIDWITTKEKKIGVS